MNEEFVCVNCGARVSLRAVGTKNRNHCPRCLFSRHLDLVPGDRRANCDGVMEPIGLAYKDEGGSKIGELCLVHKCLRCGVVSKNRIAGDDSEEEIIEVYKQSLNKSNPRASLLDSGQADEIITQLFGRPNLAKMKEKFDL